MSKPEQNERSANPFVQFVRRLIGLDPLDTPVTTDTCSKEDAECFLREAGIDLDTFQQHALLSNLPQGTNLEAEVEVMFPHIDWRRTRASGLYLFKPSDEKLERAIYQGRDLVCVVEKDRAQRVFDSLRDYKTHTMWQSVGDLVLIWARDYDIRHKHGGGGRWHFTPPNWLLLVELTDSWCTDERSLAEKIFEDGYVHHLGCNEASPYLTQLETNDE
jgi:hypothetical protein